MGKKANHSSPNHQLLLARKERSWTQQEVADRIGAPLALNVTRWERGTTFPSAHYVRQLCEIFEKSASELGLVQDKHTSLNDHLNGYSVHESPASFSSLLPTQVTPLIGREQVVIAMCSLLRRSEVRQVTFTGPGGVGKTRLALQVGTEMLDEFADGVRFVSLAPVRDPSLLISTITQALALKEVPHQSQIELLKTFLHHKSLLLLLDNFEQIIEAAALLSDLLAACPALKILVTSRSVLHLRGEHEFLVPPLALPDLTSLPTCEALAQYAAVALFLQRVHAVIPPFQMTTDNAGPIAELCVHLDGLPLALELAGARMKLFSPQALLARLGHLLPLLVSGTRDAPERQQTLRQTIAWSYHLLTSEEQRLFRYLSVFVGGCTLEAVEAVCEMTGKWEGTVVDALTSLLDQSLLQAIRRAGEEPRFLMLETIGEYGLEFLATCGEMEIARQAHADYYLALAEQAEPELRGPQQAAWLRRLEREYDNLRAAMRWLLEPEEAEHRMEMALRFVEAVRRFWLIRGHYNEGRNFLEQALAGSEGVVTSLRAYVLYDAATLAYLQGDYEQGEALCEESLSLFRELGNKQGIATCLYLLGGGGQDWGGIARTRGNLAEARSLTEEALALNREMGEKWGIAWDLLSLAGLLSQQGEYSRARALLEESLEMHRELGNAMGISGSLLWLAWVHFLSQSDSAKVRSLLEEGLMLIKELGDKEAIAFYCYVSGQVALNQGDAATARLLVEESVVLYREMGYRQGTIRSLSALADVIAVQGNQQAARVLYEESLAVAREIGDKWAIASSFEGLASVVASQGEPEWAARLWGAAEALREAVSAPLAPVDRASYEQSITTARTQLGVKAFAATWAEGRTMTLEQVVVAQEPVTIAPLIPLMPQPLTPPPPSPPAPLELTRRELEVLCLLVQGLTNAQNAERLVITYRTVNWYLTMIYRKIGASSRVTATQYAREYHLVD